MQDSNLQEKPKEVIRVSVSEAAKLFGVNSQTIRRAIAAKEVIYIVVAGRYKLNFESLVKWSQLHTTVKNKLENKGIGQFVGNWKIKNALYSPSSKIVTNKEPIDKKESTQENTAQASPQNPL
ncbi:MAG: hypothetical protein A2534_02490 [Candidatus Magasanikbacteria bacterium RIFOXYD2_FULL_39_9]|uniref:Helix-turn-helix domain-containing protein n=1 Tax=Candidatus Magasanikbacteria bacterium RIFOXYD1_FULL_40_23 TaxID=1798705 RepID=A0A1F6P9W8_9BACT|nr:MAG: hypothetical protein A2563_04575 [Candidatus Magasanikbacteria bacterium RIFOXYD1_FULL_40_23]OGH93568.1 MAG: hypothetical protein A2534_02490 [Candidatus Magasanikbacteria bacterium RIFOXYD2_FULL_39_9]